MKLDTEVRHAGQHTTIVLDINSFVNDVPAHIDDGKTPENLLFHASTDYTNIFITFRLPIAVGVVLLKLFDARETNVSECKYPRVHCP